MNWQSATTVQFFHPRDSIMDEARYVTIPLNNNIGSTVLVELYFDSKWMMISEVQFISGKNAELWFRFNRAKYVLNWCNILLKRQASHSATFNIK